MFPTITEFPVTLEMLTWAEHQGAHLATVSDKYKDVNLNIACYLGELAVAMHRNAEHVSLHNFNCDVIDPELGRLDVKTKYRQFRPIPTWACNVAKKQHQDCDGYVFCTVLKDRSKLWIEGWLTKAEFLAVAWTSTKKPDPGTWDGRKGESEEQWECEQRHLHTLPARVEFAAQGAPY